MLKVTTATSNANKRKMVHVRAIYNPNGKGFKETLTAAVRQLVSSGEFETVAINNGTRDSRKLNNR